MTIVRRKPLAAMTLAALCSSLACSASWAASDSKNVAGSSSDPLVVAVASGQLRGAKRPSGGAEFLGIPFAQPPVGDSRWREPQPPVPWKGVRDARVFGAPCAQAVLGGDWNRRDAETSSEDCLFLNVMTPVWPPKNPLPVMVWLHGGANAGGAASSSLYKDGTLVQHGIVLVTVNYRLGVFGFLAHPELTRESPHHASGNYALMDQIAALRWVRDNIARFGGDPARVTLFGQSAGAHDASILMTSPPAKGLFHRVIAQSASAVQGPFPALKDAETYGASLSQLLKGPSGAGALRFLRQVPARDLLDRLPLQDVTAPPQIGPIVDGWVVPRGPMTVFNAGEQAPVALMIGTTAREFGMEAPVEAVRGMIQGVMGNDLSARTLELYGLNGTGSGQSDPVYGRVGDQWFADLVFRCPATLQATWHAAAHHPTYQYEFRRVIPGHESEGSAHSFDLPYVFGFYPKEGNLAGQYTGVDDRIADAVQRYWVNFAKTGDPNGGSLPVWPAFAPSQAFIRFMEDGRVLPATGGLRPAQCELIHERAKQLVAELK
jgi:para-nitrobenzyl esterase